MANVKSENFWAGVGAGAYARWVHIDVGLTGRTTIKPRANETVILCNLVVNTSGAGGSTILSDSKTGIIAQLKASVAEKDYHYQLPLAKGGNLTVDNNGSDLTVMFVNY